MANSLLRLKRRFSANGIISHALQKSFTRLNVSSGYRSIMSIAINTNTTIPDILPPHEAYHHDDRSTSVNSQTLKAKEKGDWRFLTMEEKKQLYQISFIQPFEMTPDDDWKTILASTFTAMGLMTMATYFWLIHFGNFRSFEQPPLIVDTFQEHSVQAEAFFSEKIEDESFDSQSSH